MKTTSFVFTVFIFNKCNKATGIIFRDDDTALSFVPVKIFTNILSIYILLISLFPCPEDLRKQEQEELVASVAQQPADDDCEDECPPFCGCACCGVQMMRTCNCVHFKTPVQYAVHHAVVPIFTLSDIYRPIWQPPQLS